MTTAGTGLRPLSAPPGAAVRAASAAAEGNAQHRCRIRSQSAPSPRKTGAAPADAVPVAEPADAASGIPAV